ncbi:MAG: hypothetical protein EON59_15665, partial [Alphaproteobacteria bacterium]
MAILTKQIRALVADGNFAAVRRAVEASPESLENPKVRRAYVQALEAVGDRVTIERVLAFNTAQTPEVAETVNAYLKRESGRAPTQAEYETVCDLAATGGGVVTGRKAALEMKMGQIELAFQTATLAVRTSPTREAATVLVTALADIFFRHGRLDLSDATIDLAGLAADDALWLKAKCRVGLAFDEECHRLMRLCTASGHPHHVAARRAWFDHCWVLEGPTPERLSESDAWSEEDGDIELEPYRISMAVQLGMDGRAKAMAAAKPEALKAYAHFLPIAQLLDPGNPPDFVDTQQLQSLRALSVHLNETSDVLAQQLCAPTLAIVGNAPSEMGLGRGRQIDSFHTVV